MFDGKRKPPKRMGSGGFYDFDRAWRIRYAVPSLCIGLASIAVEALADFANCMFADAIDRLKREGI